MIDVKNYSQETVVNSYSVNIIENYLIKKASEYRNAFSVIALCTELEAAFKFCKECNLNHYDRYIGLSKNFGFTKLINGDKLTDEEFGRWYDEIFSLSIYAEDVGTNIVLNKLTLKEPEKVKRKWKVVECEVSAEVKTTAILVVPDDYDNGEMSYDIVDKDTYRSLIGDALQDELDNAEWHFTDANTTRDNLNAEDVEEIFFKEEPLNLDNFKDEYGEYESTEEYEV